MAEDAASPDRTSRTCACSILCIRPARFARRRLVYSNLPLSSGLRAPACSLSASLVSLRQADESSAGSIIAPPFTVNALLRERLGFVGAKGIALNHRPDEALATVDKAL